MPMVVELRDSQGLVLGEAGESPPRKWLPLPDPEEEAFPLLRGVDEYSITYFSSNQMNWLVPELDALRDRTEIHEEQLLIDEILRLARTCAESPHRLLVFIGD